MAVTIDKRREQLGYNPRAQQQAAQAQQAAATPQAAQSQPVQNVTPQTVTSQPAAPAAQQTAQRTAYAPGEKPGAYSYANQAELDALYNQIVNRPAFNFDLANNPLWQNYRDQYTRLGSMAMQDTMGQAAGLTGGYGSSYGQAVGQQAYNRYLQELNGIVPELYAQERAAYDADGDRMLQLYGLQKDQADQDYNRYMDSYNMWFTESQAQQEQDRWQAEMDFSRQQWEWQKAQAAARSSGGGGGGSGKGGSGGTSGPTVTKSNYNGNFTNKDGDIDYAAAEDNLKEVIAAYVYAADNGGKKNVGTFDDWLRANGITGDDATLAYTLYGQYLRGEIK